MADGYRILGSIRSNLASISRSFTRSDMAVDVMVPCTEKSMKVLRAVVPSVRRNLRHRIGEIFIVAPKSESIEAYCAKEGLSYVNEVELMGFSKDMIKHVYNGEDRSGHMYQQLLKLYSDQLGKEAHIYIHDSDTLMLRPFRFDSGGKIVLQYYEHVSQEYLDHFYKLFPGYSNIDVSFICNQMFLKKSLLREIRSEIEKRHQGKPWWRTLVDLMDLSQQSGFSEYETIGQYIVHTRNPEYSKELEHYLNRGLTLGNWEKRPYKWVLFPMKYKTLSFHSYQ